MYIKFPELTEMKWKNTWKPLEMKNELFHSIPSGMMPDYS